MQALFLLLPWAVAAQTATYNIRPMQGNRFALEVFKSKLWEGRKHTFLFDRFSGSLAFDRERPERSRIRFVVESASARCVDDWVKPDQLKDIERAAVRETRPPRRTRKFSFSRLRLRCNRPIDTKSGAY